MDVLLRELRQRSSGAVEYQDTELTADVLSVGSAANCAIQLLGVAVSPRHAIIARRGGRLFIRCQRGRKVTLNGSTTATATLNEGDLIEVGGHRLRVLAPPAGFNAAIEIKLDADVTPSAFEQAFTTTLAGTWLSKRAAAWVFALVVLATGLVIPYASNAPQATPGQPARGHAALAAIATEQFWNAGPLTPAHQLVSAQHCESCHRTWFVHVRNTECSQCHQSTMAHISPAVLSQASLDPAQRCAECHREHHAAISGLIVRDDHLCVQCHAKSDSTFGSHKLSPVSSFANHPEFTVALLTPDRDIRRAPLATAVDQSGLTFSHAQHLDATRVTRATDGGALGCGDCHTLEPDGQHFIPITMQRSCAGCHQLTFDPDVPDRQLPHGRTREAMLLIQDYFAHQAVEPRVGASEFVRRRLPDEIADKTAPACTGTAVACARERAESEIEYQFKTKGCATCHHVLDTHSTEILDRFLVAPVRLTRDYFPDTRFSHRSHSVQNDKTGDAACVSCHAVNTAQDSSRLFIPALAKCAECHSERAQIDHVALQCSSCHSYHRKSVIASAGEAEVQ
jgi:predicted CXXCH cytochrome family protein